tara:strand:+ start:217 stop:489 length:273 start_codon:yes stop_codon:yes gene_type:complete
MKTEMKKIKTHTLYTDWYFLLKGTQKYMDSNVTGISEPFEDEDGNDLFVVFTHNGKFRVSPDTIIETDIVKIAGYDDWGWTDENIKNEEK